jgi:hypothetical protein
MSQTELDQLERDVETARDRVTQDLERLRSPSTLSDFKDGIRTEAYAFRDDLVGKATAYRDDLVDKTTNAVRDRAQRLLADIKERAAANPLAALAIGAGLAWRLLHKPPIATVLVGGGLVALLKTDPRHPAMGAELVPQAHDLAIAVRDKAKELVAEASDMVAAGRTKLGEWTDDAGDAIARTAVAAEPAKEALKRWGADAQEAASEFGVGAKAVVEQGSETIQRIVQDPEERDKYLLGAAAVALIAAVGIASQRT